jgi:CRP/FNR family transcriptional regulator, cyclic AMP receptor protein
LIGSPSGQGRSRFDAFVRLFDVEPGLLREADPASRDHLRQTVTAPSLFLQRGPWFDPPQLESGSYGYLILDGFLRRDTVAYERRSVELLGRGDLIRPWQRGDLGYVDYACEWHALTPCQLAVLDQQISEALGEISGVGPELAVRATQRARSLAIQSAVARLRGVSSRLLITLWHFAERWADPAETLVVVPTPLTHELLSDLVAAERASVSRALGSLVRAGAVSRRADGLWILHGTPPASLADLDLLQGREAEAMLRDLDPEAHDGPEAPSPPNPVS